MKTEEIYVLQGAVVPTVSNVDEEISHENLDLERGRNVPIFILRV